MTDKKDVYVRVPLSWMEGLLRKAEQTNAVMLPIHPPEIHQLLGYLSTAEFLISDNQDVQ